MTYRARTVAENGEKDAFSVISDNEWNPYYKNILKKNGVKVISAKEHIGEGSEGIILEAMQSTTP